MSHPISELQVPRSPETVSEAPTNHQELIDWVEEVAALTQPADIHWCDGSAEEYDRLCQALVDAGTFSQLDEAKRPNSYLCLSDPGDVARVEDRTFICSEREEDAGPTNNWTDPAEMREKLKGLFEGCMAGPHDVRRALLDGPARLADRPHRRRAHRLRLRRRLDADHDPHGQGRARRARHRRRLRPLRAHGRRAAGRGRGSPPRGRATRRSTSSTTPRPARSGPSARATAATRCWARSASRCASRP